MPYQNSLVNLFRSVRTHLHEKRIYWHAPSAGGGTQLFFSGRGVRPGFPKCGAWGAVWTENFPIWGLVNWKFSNLGACELKISKFGGLRAQIWAKIEAAEAKNIQIFSKGCLVNWLFCLKWDPCELQERREKGVFRAAHPHTPFLGQCPPGYQPPLRTIARSHWNGRHWQLEIIYHTGCSWRPVENKTLRLQWWRQINTVQECWLDVSQYYHSCFLF